MKTISGQFFDTREWSLDVRLRAGEQAALQERPLKMIVFTCV